MHRIPGWLFSIPLALSCTGVIAADAERTKDVSDLFGHDKYELSLTSGAMFSPIGADRGRHTVDYTLSGLQFGWMLSEPGHAGWYRGNWEFALEAMGGTVFKGRGSYLVGGTVWGRYNFIQPGWHVVPYVQAGGGAEATDFDQRLIGETFNFNLDVGAGARVIVARNWALQVECRYQHLSNAKLSKHDVGINAVGPMIGLSYFF
jgi:opacity protein-like surface antigen